MKVGDLIHVRRRSGVVEALPVDETLVSEREARFAALPADQQALVDDSLQAELADMRARTTRRRRRASR